MQGEKRTEEESGTEGEKVEEMEKRGTQEGKGEQKEKEGQREKKWDRVRICRLIEQTEYITDKQQDRQQDHHHFKSERYGDLQNFKMTMTLTSDKQTSINYSLSTL